MKNLLHIPMSEYAQLRGVSSGAINAFLRSPQHYRHYISTPSVSTPAQQLGTLVHTAVLEPRAYRNRYVVAPDIDRRTKAGKDAWSMFSEANSDKEIVTQAQDQIAWSIVDALSQMPEYRSLIYSGEAQWVEVSRQQEDADTGLMKKGRADILRSDGVVIDLKTAADASPGAFSRSAASWGYHIQGAYYCDLFGADRFAFIAVETKPPYCAGIYWLDEASLELGRQQYRQALAGIARCKHEDQWPIGYGEQEISLPNWAFYEQEDAEVVL